MRIVRDTEHELRLSGRRIDGEQGEEGLWLVWLVGFLMSGAGFTFGFLIESEEPGFRIAGYAALAFGAFLLACGIALALKRESLVLDATLRQGSYTRYVGAGWKPERTTFAFADAKEVRLKEKVESPGTGRGDSASVAYRKLEAKLHVKPRQIILLDRSKDEARVRSLAERAARRLEIGVTEP